MSNAALEQLVDEVRDLPLTVSDVLAQVITECDNADASVSSLARIMAGDQALAAMVLKLANSAYYGYARRIESLPDAVVLLGFASVKNLAITASITRLLATDQDDLTEIRSGIFDHSLCTAVCARILGRTKRVSGEKAFVAGLLHDLGLIVLVCYAKDRFRQLYAVASERNLPLDEVELEVLGFTTAALGSAVAAEWQFPPALCDALAHQHDPSARRGRPAARPHRAPRGLARQAPLRSASSAPRCARSRTPPPRPSSRSAPHRSPASSPRRSRSSRKASRCARSAAPPSSTPFDFPTIGRLRRRPIGGTPVLFMVIERFRTRDPRPIYRHLRDHGRGMPEGLRYVDSWVEPGFESLLPADGVRRREPVAAVGAALAGPRRVRDRARRAVGRDHARTSSRVSSGVSRPGASRAPAR